MLDRTKKRTAKTPRRKKRKAAAPTGNASPVVEADSQALPCPELPFDQSFFQVQFPHLVGAQPASKALADKRGRPYVVTVTLGDGMTQYDVARFEQLEASWMLVAVAEEGGFTETNRYAFVPYAAVARVEVAGADQRRPSIGFRARRVGSAGPEGADASAGAKGGRSRRRVKKKTTAARRVTKKKTTAAKKVTKKKVTKKRPAAKTAAQKKPLKKTTTRKKPAKARRKTR